MGRPGLLVTDHVTTQPARRVVPSRGRLLTLSDVRAELWRPSGTAGGNGVFSVVWTENDRRHCWAALHDFEPATQLQMINSCRLVDRKGWLGHDRIDGARLSVISRGEAT
jgi:hypothetical protein